MSTAQLHAAFDGDAALRAGVEALLEAGVNGEKIGLRSAAPIVDLPISPPRSRVLVWALLGAALGATIAFLLYSLTSRAYPMPTGGMPIMSGPPLVIIMWEGTALGLVLMTVAGVLLEGKLLRPPQKVGPLDDRLASGEHLLELALDEGDAKVLEEALAPHATSVEVVD